MGTNSSACKINVTGGYIYVNADGDGIDSNGSMAFSGGTILVDGPTNDGNAAVDGNGTIKFDGGLIVAAGSSGMVELPEDSSAQNFVVVTLDDYLDA